MNECTVHVWNDELTILEQNIVALWRDWAVGALRDDFGSDFGSVVLVNHLLASTR